MVMNEHIVYKLFEGKNRDSEKDQCQDFVCFLRFDSLFLDSRQVDEFWGLTLAQISV